MTILLVDADHMAYAAARVPKKYDPEGFCRTEEQCEASCEAWLHNLLYEIETKYGYTVSHYKLFLEGYNNFRRIIYPQYKAHRKQRVKPPMLDYARQYLINHYNAYVSAGTETDDTIAATWKALKTINKDITVIVASADRDLRAIPCLYYNIHASSRTLHKITSQEAAYNFYKSMLIGDKEDGIEGLHAIGETKADKILAGSLTKKTMLMRVYREYIKHYGRKARSKFELNYLLLKLVVTGIDYPTEFEEINI